MTEPGPPPGGRLRGTPLHDWHRANGGRMVEFAGWEMPVQYRSGIVAEHLATRRDAGLFDVSHMGRFRLRGPGSEAALRRVLTNDAATLAAGSAHYTFLANDQGGAVDDAYLYRLAADDFLLVVNASNRARGFEWIEERLEGGVLLTDESEALAMIALQGPGSERKLESVVPAGSLPEARRNRHATVRFEGGDLVVARTGYTGERVCFEIFAGAERIESLWTGSRRRARPRSASARAIRCASRRACRSTGTSSGRTRKGWRSPSSRTRSPASECAAREAVRNSWAAPRSNASARRSRGSRAATPAPPRCCPASSPPSRCPGGAGRCEPDRRCSTRDVHAGYVTSGTSVPTGRDDAAGRPEMRPIGLALIDSALRLREDDPVRLRVLDARGNESEAAIVTGNL